jgi:hypothetical protein
VVSAVDLVRGLLGMPAVHPQIFPHLDKKTGLTWTDDTPLVADRVEIAPTRPGVLVLVRGGAHRTETPVWAEAAQDLRARLIDLVTVPQPRLLARLLEVERGRLRFRTAATADLNEARQVAGRLMAEALDRLPPAPSVH